MFSNNKGKHANHNYPNRNKKESKKFKPIVIIDLTEPLAIKTIRKDNDLYFTYDPRGVSINNIPVDYCKYCCCPEPYCAEKMSGRYWYEYMERLVGWMGFKYYKLETRDIKWDI